MKNTNLSDLQQRLLDMLKWFHAFCIEHDLKYYLLYGSMLGAARHQGFIPWDDDVDVGMPREDYDKLCVLLSERLVDNYILETPYSAAKEYCFPIAKLYDTRTTLIENKRYQVKRGIFIDVFPLDGIGNSLEESKKNYKEIEKKYHFLLTRMCGIRKGRKLYKNIAVMLMRCVPQFVVNDKKLLRNLDRLCAARGYEDNKYVASLLGAYGSREIVSKDIIGVPTLYKFEDTLVYGVEDYEKYLTLLYKDWEKLPPAEKRGTHHDFVSLSLDEPFIRL